MASSEPQHRLRGAAAGILVGAGGFAAAALVAGFFLSVFRPDPWTRVDAGRGEPANAVLRAVQPSAIREWQEAFLRCGSRFPGAPGGPAAEALVRRVFEENGLEILEHHVETAAPVTEFREIRAARRGSKSWKDDPLLDGVEVYPFFPNHLQPVTTGVEGVAGTLLPLTPDILRTRADFSDAIGLLDAKEGRHDPVLGFDWVRYARLGLKAIIVSHSDGLDAARWDVIGGMWNGMVSSVPVNFVRLAATPSIFAHAGERVRLRVLVRFKPVPNTILYGVLRAPGTPGECVVLPAPRDAMSVLPDLSPGAMQAIAPAIQLQLVRGLAAERARLGRDVVFISYATSALAEDGLNHLSRILQKNTHRSGANPLLRAMGLPTPPGVNQRVRHLEKRRERNEAATAPVRACAALLEDARFLEDADATEAALDRLGREDAAFCRAQFSHVLNEAVLERAEPLLQRRLAFLRGGEDVDSPEFRAYLQARHFHDAAVSRAGYSAANLLRTHPAFARETRVRERFAGRIGVLADFHAATARRIGEEKAIAELFDRYRNPIFFHARLAPATAPGGETFTLHTGWRKEGPRIAAVFDLFAAAARRAAGAGPGAGAALYVPNRTTGDRIGETAPINQFEALANTERWGYAGYLAFHTGRQTSYRDFTSPVVRPFMRDVGSVAGALAAVGEGIFAFARGLGPSDPSAIQEWVYFSYGGQVLLSDVGRSAVPNFPLAGAALANRSLESVNLYSFPGFYQHPIILTDPYGRFRLDFNSNDFPVHWRASSRGYEYSPLAAGYGADGLIHFVKDEGEDGQRLFKSAKLSLRSGARENTTIVAFRAAPVSVLELTNPQNMKDYSGVRAHTAEGITAFRKNLNIEGPGINTTFLEPDRRAYFSLLSGAPDNDLVLLPRAFLLGVRDPDGPPGRREIDGPGYLVADHPILQRVPLEAGRSMASVNGRRLALQERFHMADGQTVEYQQRTLRHLGQAAAPGIPHAKSVDEARSAVTYATLSHPVIRRSVLEAVIGIVWYLGLLVPFVFFFEKLLFCFADVRKQLAAQAAIFLAVFLLLRLLHPAFEMVRSSLMILLGFVIILISGGITLLFSGKFRENLEELRRARGRVAGTEANTLGVVGSAFMLGLNNMHRRKVRTGLTCATLTLLTFVMICFTSVRSDITSEDVPLGKAGYQGILVRKPRFEPLSDAEVFAFRSRYGSKGEIAPRRLFRGTLDGQDRQAYNPEFQALRETPSGPRLAAFDSVLQLSHLEPLRERVQFLSKPAWFTEADAAENDLPPAIFLPEELAARLGVTPEEVNTAPVPVSINGSPFVVRGVFKAASLDQLRDLDGVDLLPFDIESMQNPAETGRSRYFAANPDDPRIPASRLVLAPLRGLFSSVPRGVAINASLALAMPGVPYKDASARIQAFMEQTAEPVHYGLDGVAYRGRRAREWSLAGLVDLIIPLAIAGLTVLNTMKGSVYERRDEIFVYNAVGIAPRYVFFMFIAEALVYAVVGCVLGYLLSQGTGRILTELGWTGGLNMTFASLSTIYASLTIMAATVLSTWFPARQAMEIATPADEAGWRIPEPDGDDLAFDLPFNFRPKGRLAVLAFFDRWLRDHAEGSAGPFFAADPRMAVADPGAEAYVPQLATTVWLKPFDLAVSQRLLIATPPDLDTGQFKACLVLTRLSGTRESWLRLNRSFVAGMRRHFLHWRAVTPHGRAELYEEARTRLRQDTASQPPPAAAQPA